MNQVVHRAFDAQAALGFVISQTSHIEAGVNRTVYPDIQYPDLVPVDTTAHPWAKTVTYYSGDIFGAAKWINANSDDVPIAGSELTKHETAVYTAGIGYAFGYGEVNQAMMLGVPLQTEDAAAARRAYEEMVDRVVMLGDTTKNFQGLIDHSAVTPAAAPVGDWGGTGSTPATVLGDINFGLMAVGSGTLWTSWADTLLLPHEKIAYLGETVLDGTAVTLLQHVMANNAYTTLTGRPLRIRGIRALMTAGVSDVPRMIAYRRDPNVLKVHIPMPHRFLPVWQAGPLRWEVPGIFRLGGLDIRRPKEVRYVDGI